MPRLTYRGVLALSLMALIVLQAASASSPRLHHRRLISSIRALLVASPSSNAGDSPVTCCNCKCVVPTPTPASCKPGLLCGAQALPPTYGKKKLCKNGFANSCDEVCLVNKGSWQAYNNC